MKQKLVIVTILVLFLNGINLIAQSKSERFNKGWDKLKQIDGHAGEKVIENLSDISPELGDYIIEYLFGDVYGRSAISDKEREIAVVAALTAMGNAAPQLKVHLFAALNTGNSPEEIVQVINQTSPYAGLPATLNALNIFREVMAERKIDFKVKTKSDIDYPKEIEKGKTKLDKLRPNQHQNLTNYLSEVAPEVAEYITFTYGYLLNENILKAEDRLIGTIAVLTAKGNTPSTLKFYIEAALHVGLSPEKIREIMITMSGYAGFPAALNGMFILKQVLKEQNITIKI